VTYVSKNCIRDGGISVMRQVAAADRYCIYRKSEATFTCQIIPPKKSQ
jgi:hypothetical protein